MENYDDIKQLTKVLVLLKDNNLLQDEDFLSALDVVSEKLEISKADNEAL